MFSDTQCSIHFRCNIREFFVTVILALKHPLSINFRSPLIILWDGSWSYPSWHWTRGGVHPGQSRGSSQGFSPAWNQPACIQALPVCSRFSHQLVCCERHVTLIAPNQNILNNDPRIITSASCRNWTGAGASFSAQCAKFLWCTPPPSLCCLCFTVFHGKPKLPAAPRWNTCVDMCVKGATAQRRLHSELALCVPWVCCQFKEWLKVDSWR